MVLQTQYSLSARLLAVWTPWNREIQLQFSIAGEFDLDVYILHISSLNDNYLKPLFAELPRHYVVLLEDVDAVVSKRTENVNTNDIHNTSSPKRSTDAMMSLSTLLNILNGVGSPEGRVLIM